ncbi:MAG: hypothetical protein WDO14_05500 [Bacteroidota bacterium]
MHSDDSNDEDKALRLIDETLRKNKLEPPSSNFTHRVMMNLHSLPVASSLSPKNGVLLLCGTILALTILTVLVSSGMFDSAVQTIDVPQVKTTISVDGKWIVNGLVVLNIVLAFVLLDRTILRPLFNRRAMN